MCSVCIEEILLNLNRLQLTTFQGDDIFHYYVVDERTDKSPPVTK